MDKIAPAGTTFGSHPGDGSDFGFWILDADDDYAEGGKPLGSTGLFAKGGKSGKQRVHSGRYLTLTTNGNQLKISLTDEGKKWVKEEGPITYQNFDDLFDDVRGNSELIFFPDLGDAYLGMTSAPGITDGYYYSDDGEMESHKNARLWYYNDYAIKDPFEVLSTKNSVSFDEHKEYAKGGKTAPAFNFYERVAYVMKKKYGLVPNDFDWTEEKAKAVEASGESVDQYVLAYAEKYDLDDINQFAEGGKPLGSTGLFAKGGITADSFDDYEAARDVELFAENDHNLYKQRWIPILKNLKKKKDKGVFDVEKAAILMKYFVDDADKRYQKEVNGDRMPKGYFLSVNDRKLLSKQLAENVAGMSDADMTFEDGGKPLGSTGLFEEGGKPLGSTGLFSEGGVAQSRINRIVKEYKIAALWSSTDDEGNPLDADYELSDIAEPTARKMRDNVAKFLTENEKDIEESGLDEGQLGHSLWLTQNRHGAGFFDFSMNDEVEDRLTKSAQDLKEMDLYVGDDGKIWGSGSESYADGGKPLGSTGLFKDGGTADESAPGDTATDSALDTVEEMKAGGTTVARITNIEAKEYSENKFPFKGNSLEGKLLDNGDYVVLSYGYYPIWYFSTREGKWYGNATKYSVTTSRQLSQSRPDYNVTMLENDALLEKMKTDEAHFDLGGLMINNLYPIGDRALPTDNVTLAHGNGTGLVTPQQ